MPENINCHQEIANLTVLGLKQLYTHGLLILITGLFYRL